LRQSAARFTLVAVAALVLFARAATGQEPDEDKFLKELLDAHNEIRAESKLPPLTINPKLESAAKVHARDMAEHEKMSHDGSDGSTPGTRITKQEYRYRACGENVARGQENVRQVMRTWFDSPPHKKNILGDFTEMGGAFAKSADGQLFWCVDFGRPWPELSPEKASSQLIDAINEARHTEKKKALKPNDALQRVAQKHAREIAAADELRQESDDGAGPAKQVQGAGYRFRKLAQELFSGEFDSKVIVETWLKEDIHRGNVLGDFNDIGVGYAATPKGTPYWCVIFAKAR
jgi:uncharacterized protein YkwD